MCAELGNGHSTGTVDGISVPGGDTSWSDKGWNITVALGSIAFAYSYSYILLEMTVRSTLLWQRCVLPSHTCMPCEGERHCPLGGG